MKLRIFGILVISILIKNVFNCELEDQLIKNGLIDINELDSSIKIEIINATKNNILGINSYGCLNKCFLQPDAAKKIINAQKILKRQYPGYSLKVLEGTRPRSVQKKMYDVVKNTSIKKYVADPIKGSMHNYGTAVDITIVDENGIELKMGKPDPRIKIVGKSDLEIKIFFILNKPNKQEVKNRELLKSIMKAATFNPISYEWWHFDGFNKEFVRQHFKIIE
jgi:D-alanyl-D-alanine dipeptidase